MSITPKAFLILWKVFLTPPIALTLLKIYTVRLFYILNEAMGITCFLEDKAHIYLVIYFIIVIWFGLCICYFRFIKLSQQSIALHLYHIMPRSSYCLRQSTRIILKNSNSNKKEVFQILTLSDSKLRLK